ncbi:hypothetical protein [Bosea sp. UNC402CLCol]|uniref:hypothetical protein n=1 Tax=Bosea sp. UNC402CLCol TaxID=1510531 RepID=UPI00056E731A|nr:hypothetical protein [Bosea sp. UNC402CLCol]
MSIPVHPRELTLSQQLVNLRSNPLSVGDGGIAGGELVWRFRASPSPVSRVYDLRLTYVEAEAPKIFVDEPDLTLLANGVRIPHLYSERPARLCLYLPEAYEWRSSMLLDRTMVPWAILWLWYFEDWLATGEWRGGGVHVSEGEPGVVGRHIRRALVAKRRTEAA